LLFDQSIIAQQYGLKSGLAFSSITGQGAYNIRPGIQLGGYANFGYTESLYFRAELLFTQKGSSNWNISNPNKINLYYLEIPVMYCIDFLDKFTLNMGFSPSMLLTATRKTSENGENSFGFIGRELTRFDYSTFIGLEYLWKNNFSFGARYNHSFVPISSYESNLYVDGILPVSRTFQIYCTYKLIK